MEKRHKAFLSHMVISNIFLLLPAMYAFFYQEWTYFFFAAGLFIFSPCFHWFRIADQRSVYYGIFRKLDWLFAAGGFFYMFFYINEHLSGVHAELLYLFAFSLLAFFWYGWLQGDYRKLHPWFHVMGGVLSTIVLVFVNI